MKVLTVWQPWSSLIAYGWKPYEFRSRPPPKTVVGKRIAIHAGARPITNGEIWDLIRRLDNEECGVDPAARGWLEDCFNKKVRPPLSCIVCTALLGKPINGRDFAEGRGWVNDSNRDQHFNWAWPMSDIKQVPNVPARGRQGFWDLVW